MIPKLIHYCWFGPSPLPADSQQFIEGWRKLHPEFEFKYWNEKNIPDFPNVKRNLENGQYAFASDYIRLWALKEYGGIYLDTDFEVLKPLDSLCGLNCFVAFQYKKKNKYWVTNAIMGSFPDHPFILDCIKTMDDWDQHNPEQSLISPELTTKILTSYGLIYYGHQTIKDVTILVKEVFYPLSFREFLNHQPLNIGPKTLAVHHFHGSWLDKDRAKKTQSTNLLKRIFRRLKKFFKVH